MKLTPREGTAGAFIYPSAGTQRLISITLHENKAEVGAAYFGSSQSWGQGWGEMNLGGLVHSTGVSLGMEPAPSEGGGKCSRQGPRCAAKATAAKKTCFAGVKTLAQL